FSLAELAQVDAAQQLVGVNVVGRGLEQATGGDFGLLRPADAEVESSQGVIQLRRVWVGVEGQLVLLNGPVDVLRLALRDSTVLINAGQCHVKVGLGAVGSLCGRCGRCRFGRRRTGRGSRKGRLGLCRLG